jgi:hypothetical protein
MTERMPAIRQIEEEVAATRQSAIDGVKSLQVCCPHDKVVAGGDRRICASCGLEECNRYSWPGYTSDGGFYEFVRPAGEPTVLNTEFVKSGDVIRYRVSV